jgi:hypothetical protein
MTTRRPLPASTVEHFGELVRPGKYGLRLTREMYAVVNKRSSTRIPEHILTDELRAFLAPHYEDAELTIHTDEFCQRHREAACLLSTQVGIQGLELLKLLFPQRRLVLRRSRPIHGVAKLLKGFHCGFWIICHCRPQLSIPPE